MDEFLKDKRVFLAGHRGFIGSALHHHLRKAGCCVEVLGGDITTPDAWDSLGDRFDFVIHLVAVENERDIDHEIQVNARSALHLAQHVATLKSKPRIIFASSTNIFGAHTDLVDENSVDMPLGIWSAHKLLAENYLRMFREKGVESAILRLPNVYGIDQNESVATRSAVNRAIKSCVATNELTLYANRDCVRDYLHVSDVRGMILEAMRLFDEFKQFQKIILGSGRCLRISQLWAEIARQYENITGEKAKLFINSSAPMDAFAMRSHTISNALFFKISGYRSHVSLEDGIAATVKFFVSRM